MEAEEQVYAIQWKYFFLIGLLTVIILDLIFVLVVKGDKLIQLLIASILLIPVIQIGLLFLIIGYTKIIINQYKIIFYNGLIKKKTIVSFSEINKMILERDRHGFYYEISLKNNKKISFYYRRYVKGDEIPKHIIEKAHLNENQRQIWIRN